VKRGRAKGQREGDNMKNEKITGIIIGVVITLGIIGIINSISFSSAHQAGLNNDMMGDGNMIGNNGDGMMNGQGGMNMMHSMMMGGSMMSDENMMGNDDIMNGDGVSCMSMMKNHGDMTEECGMSIEACRRMMS